MKKKNKLSKVLLTAAALLVVTANVYPIPKGPCEKPKEVCCEEPAPGPFAFSYPQDKGLACPRDFYVMGELLLMQVKEDGLEYAVTQGTGNTNDFPLTEGDIHGYSTGSKSWDWTLGCRVNIGFYLNHDSWNLDARWTYLRINNDSGLNISGGSLLPFWMIPEVTVGATNMSSSERWTGDINTLDLKLGKPYHISRYVVFNPHFGLRLAWIERDLLVRNGGTFTIGENQEEGVDMKGKNDFWGVGPRAGLNTEWHLGAGWYLIGDVSASILYSHFDVDQSMNFHSTPLYQLKHDFYTNSPNMELIIGICWSHLFSKNKYMVSLKVAYEMHQWWDQNRFRRFFDNASPIANDEVSRGDLKINGLSFAIGFDF